MMLLSEYDVAIIGGGLAGLSAAILLSKQGRTVVLFEKETYPYHKVCGEYISKESRPFLESLGVPLQQWKLPEIDRLLLTAPNGKTFTTKLPLGGFGMSRYKLDHCLAQLALHYGVHLVQRTKVVAVESKERYNIFYQTEGEGQQNLKANIALGAWGKKSNIDAKWQRAFVQHSKSNLDNFIGVKYHVHSSWPEDVIGLHNFKNGYCGISKIEDDRYCLCYLTTARNLKESGNSIAQLEANILRRNPHLEKIFSESRVLEGFPVTISQISFEKKTQVENDVLMLGDTAGMITPLCGNGMSIALHTGKIAAELLEKYFHNKISKQQLEQTYTAQWQQHFGRRLQTGRFIQGFFGSSTLSNIFTGAFKTFPFLASPMIKMTHGKPF